MQTVLVGGSSCWFFVAGCGEEAVTVPPVVSTIPANGATAGGSETRPSGATFSVTHQ